MFVENDISIHRCLTCQKASFEIFSPFKKCVCLRQKEICFFFWLAWYVNPTTTVHCYESSFKSTEDIKNFGTQWERKHFFHYFNLFCFSFCFCWAEKEKVTIWKINFSILCGTYMHLLGTLRCTTIMKKLLTSTFIISKFDCAANQAKSQMCSDFWL